MTELSIIIVNWNSLDFLRRCIPTILSNISGIEHEIIVVDNASTVGRISDLSAEYRNLTLVESSDNLGFARANNLGFRKSSGKYILFLNPDTEIQGDAIATMLGHLKALPNAAVIGCTHLNTDGSVETNCIQRFPNILNQTLSSDFLRRRWPHWRLWGIEPLLSETGNPSEVEMVSGACLMMKRDAFEAIGLFSEDYFMYAEDLDLCYKTRQLGYKNYFIGTVRVVHHGGGSSRRRAGSQWAAIMQRKALLLFLRKTRGKIYGFAYQAVTGIVALGRVLLVALARPFATTPFRKEDLSFSLTKWMAIFKWAVGIEGNDIGRSSVAAGNKGT